MTDENWDALNDVAHPICPLMMYFEGDEDKCDTSKCDFEDRRCTEACKIDVEELQKEVDKLKHTKGKLEVDGNHYLRDEQGKIVVTTAHVAGLPAEKQTANAKELVRRWNAFEKDGLVDELTRVVNLLEEAEKARGRGSFNTKQTVETCLSEVCEYVTRAYALVNVIKITFNIGENSE